MDRPLKTRGKHAALLMIEPVWKAGCRFENIFTSPARRARATIRQMSKGIKGNGVFWKVVPALYTFDGDELIRWLQDLDNSLDDVMVVGHNPAITLVASRLGDRVIEKVPTCGYVQLQADVESWRDLKKKCARTIRFITPKMVDVEETPA